jgi:hypothetical protein
VVDRGNSFVSPPSRIEDLLSISATRPLTG